jgi:hypothetical protein
MVDAIEVFWNEILTFDRFKQVGFFVSLGSRLRTGVSSVADAVGNFDDDVADLLIRLRGVPFALPAALLITSSVLGLVILAWRHRKLLAILIQQNLLNRNPSLLAPAYYLELIHVLERKGLKRRPGETPAEFARRVEPLLGSSLPDQVTQIYYRTRYGNQPLGPSELEVVRRGLRRLRTLKLQS